jgi:hypothetical protein
LAISSPSSRSAVRVCAAIALAILGPGLDAGFCGALAADRLERSQVEVRADGRVLAQDALLIESAVHGLLLRMRGLRPLPPDLV